jgi:BolA protein
MTRTELIKSRLQVLEPIELELVDESHLHAGHAGARDGRGHFRLRLLSRQFDGKSRLERHRMVFQALGELMQTDIHALSMQVQSENER